MSDTMQRRHFELIARTVRELTPELDALTGKGDELNRIIAQAFAAECRSTNANFQRDKFLKACGVSD